MTTTTPLPDIRPPIAITEADAERLFALATARLDRDPGAAPLLEELNRARIVHGSEANSAVGMNNSVTFTYDGADYRDVRLVYPAEADFANGRLSVLSHVGAMLLGLSRGQTIRWAGPDKRDHMLEVTAVGGAA
jgi:regulator of nucleoside diphosphate kinase